jgi:hypothetical protein
MHYDRRRFCGAAAAIFAAVPLSLLGTQERSQAMTQVAQQTGSGATAIRPFPQVNYSQAELDDLRAASTPRGGPHRASWYQTNRKACS